MSDVTKVTLMEEDKKKTRPKLFDLIKEAMLNEELRQAVKIGSRLSKKIKDELSQFLHEYKGVFFMKV